MEVPDGLPSVPVAVGDDPKSPVGESHLPGNACGCPEDLSRQVIGGIVHIHDGRNVLPGYNEIVMGGLRRDVLQHHQVRILVKYLAGASAVYDGAENALFSHIRPFLRRGMIRQGL